MITTKTFLQAVRQHGGAKWLFWALCLLLSYALVAQLAGYRQQTFDQAQQLNQTLLRRQLDYTALLLQQLTPASAAAPQAPTAELPAFVVAAGFQLFDGVQAVAAGALRGLQDTRVPMLF